MKAPYSQDTTPLTSPCLACGFKFRLKVISDRRTRTKYLRADCCDAPLRPCPEPSELLRSANLSSEERNYLQRIANLDWFTGKVASVLLQIEAKVKTSGEVSA